MKYDGPSTVASAVPMRNCYCAKVHAFGPLPCSAVAPRNNTERLLMPAQGYMTLEMIAPLMR